MASLALNSGKNDSNTNHNETFVAAALDNINKQMRHIFHLDDDAAQIQDAGILSNYIQNDLGERQIKTIINQLPIYLIIGHSALELNLYEDPRKQGKGEEEICTTGRHRSCFTLNDGEIGAPPPSGGGSGGGGMSKSSSGFQTSNYSDWLRDEARFVIYPTPPGEWGGLTEEAHCEDSGHFLRLNSNKIKQSVINGEVFIATVGQHKERYGVHSSFIPGSVVPDKEHEFHGEVLTRNGFGIVKLVGGMSSTAAADLLKTISPKELEKTNNIYYITNDTSRANPKQKKGWKAFMADIIKRSALPDGDSHKNILMSEIVKAGGPGFYISLSCSPFHAMVWSGCNVDERDISTYPHHIPKVYDKTSPYYKFWNKLAENYEDITTLNDAKWKAFFQLYPSEMQRGEGQAVATSFSSVGNANNNVAPLGRRQLDVRLKGATTRGFKKKVDEVQRNKNNSFFNNAYAKQQATNNTSNLTLSGSSSKTNPNNNCEGSNCWLGIMGGRRKKRTRRRRKKSRRKRHKRKHKTRKRRKRKKKSRRR